MLTVAFASLSDCEAHLTLKGGNRAMLYIWFGCECRLLHLRTWPTWEQLRLVWMEILSYLKDMLIIELLNQESYEPSVAIHETNNLYMLLCPNL